MIDQAVILAGGVGTRLGELTRRTPKPLLPVAGRPFLDYLVNNLRRFGIGRIVLSVGYLADQFRARYGGGSADGVQMDYEIEHTPLGTGGALRQALPRLDEQFLVLNGDTLFDFNYVDLALLCAERGALAGLALRAMSDGARYGSVDLQPDHRVRGFREKAGAGPGLISGGAYVLRRQVVESLPLGEPCSLERDVFPALAERGELVGKAYEGFFLDVGLPDTYRQAQQQFPSWLRRPAVVLDRDGVLNVDSGYVHRPEEFVWIDGAPEAIKWLNDRGYLVFVATNQSGIARGLYTEGEFLRFSDWLQEQLKARGAHIDQTYYCPHHASEGQGEYRRECNCRKPRPGLFLRAIEEWGIDLQRSFAVGHQPSDLEAARAAGMAAVRFQGGNLLACIKQAVAAPALPGCADLCA